MVTYLQQDDTQKIQDGTFSGKEGGEESTQEESKGASVPNWNILHLLYNCHSQTSRIQYWYLLIWKPCLLNYFLYFKFF